MILSPWPHFPIKNFLFNIAAPLQKKCSDNNSRGLQGKCCDGFVNKNDLHPLNNGNNIHKSRTTLSIILYVATTCDLHDRYFQQGRQG